MKNPYWMRTRFLGQCSRCGRAVAKGEQVFYYPNGRSAYCEAEDCGKQESRNYDAACFDEQVY